MSGSKPVKVKKWNVATAEKLFSQTHLVAGSVRSAYPEDRRT